MPRLVAAAKAADNDSLEGTTLSGRYEISTKLGEGGMSSVYKARDMQLDKIVALKVVLPHLVKQERNLLRFQREALSVRSLKHENIAEIYDSDIADNGVPYISMEYVEGCTLMELIDKERYLSYARAVPMFCQIADALQHAHTQGIIHRDLKPSNILVRTKDGRESISIVDFGLAKMLPHADVQSTTLTHTGDVFGSPPYMSPQQCRGEKVDHRTDIYSFGCLMYETLTGRPPLVAETTVTTILKHLETIPPPTFETCPQAKVPGTLEAIIFKTLAKEPAARQQSMLQIQNELRSFLSLQEAGLEYKPIGAGAQFNQYRIRHPKGVGWSAAIIAAVLISSLTWWWHWINVRGEGSFHLLGFAAISVILGYVAFRAKRLNEKMESVSPNSPVWQLPWHSPPLITTVDTSEQKRVLDGFITKIEEGASLQNRDSQEELRKVLKELSLSGCLEDVQNSSTHAIEVLRKQGKEKIEVTLIFKEFLADTLCASYIFDRAETAYRAVLGGWDEFDVFSSEVRCAVQLKLADALFLQQKVVGAEDLYTTYLARWDMLNLPHDAAYALRLSRLADCYCKAEKFKLAEETYLKLIGLWQDIDPANSSLAFVKHAYTRVKCWRQIDQMKRLGTEVDSIEKIFGTTSAHTGAAKSLYATCLWKEHSFTKAIEYRRSADSIAATSIASIR